MTASAQATHEAFVALVGRQTGALSPPDLAARIDGLVRGHDAWREHCLNLNPAESLLSTRCRALLASDMSTRLTEGAPGAKVYPRGPQNRFVDELEAIIIDQVRRQFGARHVEWRPVSTSMANAAVFFALLSQGDLVFSQSEDGGGNYSYQADGPLGLAGALIEPIPWHGEFEIDVDLLARAARRLKPRMIVLGGSNVLFPYPLRDLRRIADEVGAIILYDAAHLGLLISAGDFQRPLEEGADVVTVSTHKVMGGPVGGLVLTNDEVIGAKVARVVFPGFLQTRDQNKYAALAMALTETAQGGVELAARMVRNARALTAALAAHDVDVLGAGRDYTECHQLFLRLGPRADVFEARCQAAGILLSSANLPGDVSRGRRSGARLATHELTRVGMGEEEMGRVAEMVRRAGFDGEDAGSVARDVHALRARYPTP